MKQVDQTVYEYFEHGSCADPCLLFWLPHILPSLRVDGKITDEHGAEVREVLLGYIATHAVQCTQTNKTINHKINHNIQKNTFFPGYIISLKENLNDSAWFCLELSLIHI